MWLLLSETNKKYLKKNIFMWSNFFLINSFQDCVDKKNSDWMIIITITSYILNI